MPILTIRGVPEDVMERLKQRAEVERRSINQQVITILNEGLPEERPSNWGEAYEEFRGKWETSLLTDDEADELFGRMKNPVSRRDVDPVE